MKKFCAKIIVKTKPTVKDIKGLTLKNAIESYMPIDELSCSVGSVYYINYCSKTEGEALHLANAIAKDILSNEVIETYEIRALDEIYE